MSKVICSSGLNIALSLVGSQIKILENNPNQQVVLEAKLEYPLTDFSSLRDLVVSNSIGERSLSR